MSKRTPLKLGDLQLRIMKILWERTEATVAQVSEGLPGELAYTTIATMLRKMESRHLVIHRAEGRTFIYRPLVNAASVTRSMADHLMDRLFEGNLTQAVRHLLTTRDVSREELSELEKLIAERKKSLKGQ